MEDHASAVRNRLRQARRILEDDVDVLRRIDSRRLELERPIDEAHAQGHVARRRLVHRAPERPDLAALPDERGALPVEGGHVLGKVAVVLLVPAQRLVEIVALVEENLAERSRDESFDLVDAVVPQARADEVVD